MLSRLFVAVLWSPAGKEMTSLLLFVMFDCDFVAFSCGFLGRVWYLIVSIPDLCRLSYFEGDKIAFKRTYGNIFLHSRSYHIVFIKLAQGSFNNRRMLI